MRTRQPNPVRGALNRIAPRCDLQLCAVSRGWHLARVHQCDGSEIGELCETSLSTADGLRARARIRPCVCIISTHSFTH